MNEPLYPAARTYAARLADHFVKHTAAAEHAVPACAVPPDTQAIEALVDAAFWASLQREEGYTPEISLAFLPPGRAVQPLLLQNPLPLGPRALARLSPAVERPGIHLGVWRVGSELVVWGTTRAIPSYCFVVEVLGPGLLVVKHRIREDSAKFRNVAVFEGDQVKVLSRDTAYGSDPPDLLRSLIASQSSGVTDDPDDVLLRLAVSMRAHKRGGTLLVVPEGTRGWRESIVHPITYAVEPPFTELAGLVQEKAQDGKWHGAISRVVEAVAGLTAVDGATLITDSYELLAFGVKIFRAEGRPRVEQVVVTEPVEGGAAVVMAPVQLGGTRHISAAQFAQDQQDGVALVASQDGHFTIFVWSPREGMVHAHRVESLLLLTMPDTSVVRLQAHPVLAEASASVAQGGCMVAFGLPFVAAGTYLAWVARRHPEQLDFSGPAMPMLFIYGMAALFLGSGLLLWSVGLRATIVRLRFEQRARRHPREPWLGDRAWNPKGDRERPFSSAIKGLFGIAFMLLFLAPFHWWMYTDPWIPGFLILTLFDLLFLGAVGYWIYSVGRAMKYGAARIKFDRFPFLLGESLDVRLGCRGRLDRFDKLTVTVRFIKVKQERNGSSSDNVCYQHWADQLVFDESLLRGVRELPISISLPDGDYGTWLSGDAPRYWELEAKGDGPGIDFLARFLLPVYGRP